MKQGLKLAALALAASLAIVQSATAQNVPLKLAVYPGSLISLPEYVGVNQGIYAKNGIDATIVPIPTGPAQIAAAASGSADVIGMTISLALLANNQGQDLVILTGNIGRPLFTWLKQKSYHMPDANAGYLKAAKEFKGAKIGVPARGSEVELMTRVLLRDVGLDGDKDVVWVPVGFGQTALAAFQAKQIDILGTMEPVPTILVDKNEADIAVDLQTGKDGPAIFKDFPGNSRMAVRSLTQQKSEAMKRYQKAQTEILAFIADPKNEGAIVADFVKVSGMAPDVAKKMIGRVRPNFTTQFDCKSYTDVLKYLEQSGQISADKAAKAQSCASFMAPTSIGLMKQ